MVGRATLASLPPANECLVKLMQEVNFGRIEQLKVRGGQPVLEPLPRIVREHKFGSDNGPRDERRLDGFVLKEQVVELFDELHRLGNGVVDVLTIKHGLPFNMYVNLAAGAQ